jgi:hypothetical protein
VNGQIMEWPIDDTITRLSNRNGNQSYLDYFLLMFPPSELSLITLLTSEELLIKDGKKPTTKSGNLEVLWSLYSHYLI